MIELVWLEMAMQMLENAVHADYAHICEYADADENLILSLNDDHNWWEDESELSTFHTSIYT